MASLMQHVGRNGNASITAGRKNRVEAATSSSATARAKWSWALRDLPQDEHYNIDHDLMAAPRAGDIALLEVERIGHHTRLMTADRGKLRIYPGDRMVGVFGNRYATDAFEAHVKTAEDVQMLTDAGMIGTVASKHRKMGTPTRLKFLGYLQGDTQRRLNITDLRFQPAATADLPPRTVMVIGSGMNSGKTTTAAKAVQALVRGGLRVAACKLTGSVSYRDLSELRATGAQDVRDFSCYGFPSTYLAGQDDLLGLFNTMLLDAYRSRPDIVVMEVADGMLQRETRMLLESAEVKRRLMGILLSATCAPSALYSAGQLERLGHDIMGVSGVMTSSPLFVREFVRQSELPIASSAGGGDELAELIVRHLALARLTCPSKVTPSFINVTRSGQARTAAMATSTLRKAA